MLEGLHANEEGMAPDDCPASWFPGALPRETMRALRAIDRDLELRWSPRAGVWAVWHTRNGKRYCALRWRAPGGGYRAADHELVTAMQRSRLAAKHAQDALRSERDWISEVQRPDEEKAEKAARRAHEVRAAMA